MKKLGCLLVLLVSLGAGADENIFGYSYGSETLPQGAMELYQWVTYRSGKGMGTYEAYDLKTELEYGITDRWQVSGYLNFVSHNVKDLHHHGMDDRNSGLKWQGTQVSVKHNVLSPFKDVIGLAFYLEPGYSQIHKVSGEKLTELELELKIILQKNFLDNQLMWVFNLTPEMEWVRDSEGNHKELYFEYTTGLSYRFIPNWFGGFDFRYHSEYPDVKKREHYAYFLGPTIHYGAKEWWFTFTYLPQIQGAPSEGIPGGKHYMEHEKQETRLKVGYNF